MGVCLTCEIIIRYELTRTALRLRVNDRGFSKESPDASGTTVDLSVYIMTTGTSA
jgi:hypothetical protein